MDRDVLIKNHMLMKRVNRIQNFVSKVYIMFGVPMIISMIIVQLISPNENNPFEAFFFDILAPAIMISTGVLGCYKKDNILALVSMATSFFSFGLFEWDSILGVIAFVLTVYSNKIYRFLETQEGFPLFHELHEERIKIDHAKEMQEKLERLKSTESSEMTSYETDPIYSEAPTDPPPALDPYAHKDQYQRYYEKLKKTSSSDMLDLD